MSVSKETAAYMNAQLRGDISLAGELHKALTSLAMPIPPMTAAEIAQADAEFFDTEQTGAIE